MRKIYIILTRSQTILSRIVHFITKDPYTHASIAFEEDMMTFYSSSRKNGRTLFPAGPCEERLADGYFSRHKNIPCIVYEMEVAEEIYENAKNEVSKIIDNSKKYHFNIIGLMLCRLNIPYERKRNFFCSQFVSEILKRSSAMAFSKDVTLIRPIDYMSMNGLSCCFRGTIYDYSTVCTELPMNGGA